MCTRPMAGRAASEQASSFAVALVLFVLRGAVAGIVAEVEVLELDPLELQPRDFHEQGREPALEQASFTDGLRQNFGPKLPRSAPPVVKELFNEVSQKHSGEQKAGSDASKWAYDFCGHADPTHRAKMAPATKFDKNFMSFNADRVIDPAARFGAVMMKFCGIKPTPGHPEKVEITETCRKSGHVLDALASARAASRGVDSIYQALMPWAERKTVDDSKHSGGGAAKHGGASKASLSQGILVSLLLANPGARSVFHAARGQVCAKGGAVHGGAHLVRREQRSVGKVVEQVADSTLASMHVTKAVCKQLEIADLVDQDATLPLEARTILQAMKAVSTKKLNHGHVLGGVSVTAHEVGHHVADASLQSEVAVASDIVALVIASEGLIEHLRTIRRYCKQQLRLGKGSPIAGNVRQTLDVLEGARYMKDGDEENGVVEFLDAAAALAKAGDAAVSLVRLGAKVPREACETLTGLAHSDLSIFMHFAPHLGTIA